MIRTAVLKGLVVTAIAVVGIFAPGSADGATDSAASTPSSSGAAVVQAVATQPGR